jgi:hypothetical protein
MNAVIRAHSFVREVVLPRSNYGANARERCDVVEEILERTSEVVLSLAYTGRKTRGQRSTEVLTASPRLLAGTDRA